jgi:hypothetical protein
MGPGLPSMSGDELGCSGRIGSSCLTRDTRRVNLVTNPVISHERGKDRESFYHLFLLKHLYQARKVSVHVYMRQEVSILYTDSDCLSLVSSNSSSASLWAQVSPLCQVMRSCKCFPHVCKMTTFTHNIKTDIV